MVVQGSMHIHLEPVGGIAGDMFAAALLDAWPERRGELAAALGLLPLPSGSSARAEAFSDGTLAGSRFVVSLPAPEPGHQGHDEHDHRAFRQIRELLERSALDAATIRRAIAIFTILADVEARVHGVAPDAVTFHELGAWDSIVDIVAAAFLIEAAGARSWSVAPVPIGSGRVHTDHGEMPVPPPAVALLLRGFPVFDDGRPGERVTPTGAAILRHLDPGFGMPHAVLRQGRVGYGFGARRFPGISNILRVAAFDDGPPLRTRDEIGVLRFEVDDQTPEDLAVGLERLRATPGVLDVLQTPGFGKKGRMLAQVQVLTLAGATDAVVEACLAETTTLGVRVERNERRILAREQATLNDTDGLAIRVKTAERPGGVRTVKAEMDDVAAAAGDHDDRRLRRLRIEGAAVKEKDGDG